MMDTRRTILVAILAFSLFGIWDNWQHHTGHSSIFFGPAVVATPVPSARVSDVPSSPTSVSSVSASPAGAAAIPVKAAEAPVAAQRVSVRTDLMAIDISTLGGEINRLELLTHRDTLDPSKNMVLLDKTGEHTYVAQTGLIGASLPNHHTIFTLQPGPLTLADGQNQLTVTFQAESGGVKLEKIFTFERGSYQIGVEHKITNLTDAPLHPELYLQLVRDDSKPAGSMRFYSPYYGPAVYTDANRFQMISFSDIAKKKDDAAPHDATDGWVAMLQHYFVAAWIPEQGVARTYRTESIGDNATYRAAALLPLTVAPGATTSSRARLFVGPESERLLEKVAPGLELVRNYGWSRVLAEPVFWLLETLHGFLGNWGWAIIALTVIIKLAFFPLSAASYRSMARMKSVAPKLKLVQEKYKDDRLKMNQAMMELYKTEKVNPAGGCLPILIQIPVFISLYSALSASVEMRGAPWIFWIHDLAAADPYYILPAIMMASMFAQYKLNPAPPDPMQAKMMMIMPLVFGVTFFFFPAGLVLYWVVNNLLSIAQQYYITRVMAGPAKT